MAQYSFGSGKLFGLNNIANPTPVVFGALQDVTLDYTSTVKELYGSYQFPLAVGRGTMKITGKSTVAQINARLYTDLFFGESAPQSGQLTIADSEAGTVPASSTYTITVSNAMTFVDDLGVFYATTGVQFTRVASSPTIGQYAVNTSTGVYTFAAADASVSVKISYSYTTTGGYTVNLTNQLIGTTPTFGIYLYETFQTKPMVVKFNRCISSKLTMPFKLEDFTLQDFEFSIMTDDSNNVGQISTKE